MSRYSWPKITVVTPNFNGAETLEATIESILSQDYPNLQYIVVDGGSTDGSLDIIYRYATKIDTFIHGRDENLYDGLAKGLELATGHVLTWLNSDDIYEPGILRRVGRIFKEHPRWDVIYFDGTVLKDAWRVPNRPQKLVAYPELLLGHILYQDSVFFTRRAYKSAGGLDRVRYRLAGDYDLWLRLAREHSFHYFPNQTASCFRLRKGQLSGDWYKYTAEMRSARILWSQRKSISALDLPGRMYRALKSYRINARRTLMFPLRDENQDWPSLRARGRLPLRECHCTLCGEAPQRLLTTVPDTWYGNRDAWHIYLCESCRLSFLFPTPEISEYHHLHVGALENMAKPVVEPPPGEYRPYRQSTMLLGNPLYASMNGLLKSWISPASDLCRIAARKDSYIIDIGSGAGRMLHALAEQGFRNVTGVEIHPDLCERLRAEGHRIREGDVYSMPPPDEKASAILLHQTVQFVHDPVRLLTQMKGWLAKGGRIYLSTPNIDSVWAERYGPVWSQWHAPYHRAIFSPKAIRKLAAAAGLRVRDLTTNSPVAWLCMSERLAPLGAAGVVSPRAACPDDPCHRYAEGASIASAVRWDWRGRGDCIHAILSL